MKVRRIKSCLLCGIRVGAVQSAFCYRDAKRLSVKLVWARHHTHYFQWSKLIDGYYEKGIAQTMIELEQEKL